VRLHYGAQLCAPNWYIMEPASKLLCISSEGMSIGRIHSHTANPFPPNASALPSSQLHSALQGHPLHPSHHPSHPPPLLHTTHTHPTALSPSPLLLPQPPRCLPPVCGTHTSSPTRSRSLLPCPAPAPHFRGLSSLPQLPGPCSLPPKPVPLTTRPPPAPVPLPPCPLSPSPSPAARRPSPATPPVPGLAPPRVLPQATWRVTPAPWRFPSRPPSVRAAPPTSPAWPCTWPSTPSPGRPPPTAARCR
jgi:hypothetical protein